jgi:hypothetical protein
VKGILADINSAKQVRVLLLLMQDESREPFWNSLNLKIFDFADLGLQQHDSDRAVWQKCQEEEAILITSNRNADGPESLETTIRTLGTANSLPVFTLADAHRILQERSYAERVADRLLEYLFDIDNVRGTGRLYLP